MTLSEQISAAVGHRGWVILLDSNDLVSASELDAYADRTEAVVRQCKAERHTRTAIHFCVLEDGHPGRHETGDGFLFLTFVEAVTDDKRTGDTR